MTFKTKLIKIDSEKASQYLNEYKTNFLFTVDPPICVGNDEVIVYSLLNAWIPYSFYSVNQYNQYLDVSTTVNTSYNQHTIIIPSGNYSAYDFAKVVTSELNEAFGYTHNEFKIVYNKINNTFSIYFQVASDSHAQAKFHFSTGPNSRRSCHKLMGCSTNDLLISPSVSTGIIFMNDIAYFQIKTDIGESNTVITGDDLGNLLDIIPVSSEPLSYISYSPFQPNKFLLHNTNLNGIKIALIDNMGRDVNLNGVPFLLTIKIDLVTPEEAGIPKSLGRDAEEVQEFQGQQGKTNLQIISENPSIIARPAEQNPLSLSDWIEYNLINKELAKVNKQMKSKKNKISK